ncbi:hypothetical protein [Desulfitobacterium chlororespirans]|uniref:Uncharacterized protein n=1 Tax=Desulfitobacterium chlororespirans DSM 11544 TaxID=1121395 RepID=A0A1M7UPM3_9FIRM|nr:hypothetical protein [Desulfitobacterium chlororespirans]SHN84836.1 hypothetical protein SAMN02745215_04290 [Desulfitobacterium chlororespirans DSM 11544]
MKINSSFDEGKPPVLLMIHSVMKNIPEDERVKKILSIGLILVLTLTLNTACSPTPKPSTVNSSETPPESLPGLSRSLGDLLQEQPALESIIYQRGWDKLWLCVGINNDASDKLRTLGSYGLISDIEQILWMVSRSEFTDTESEKKSAAELPVIKESELNLPHDETMLFYDHTGSKHSWIRLNYKPYIPGQGMKAWTHKDLIIYIDPDCEANAFLGVQDPQNDNLWEIHALPGCGPWLAKEIDMLASMTTAL